VFEIPAATLSFWNRLNLAPATEDQIAAISQQAPGALPGDYVAFLRTYGFVRWMLTVPDQFTYVRRSAGGQEERSTSVAHLETPESIARKMTHAWSDQPELGLPCWPEGVMPLAGNAGADQVLFDFRGDAPSIAFWQGSGDVWGYGANTELWQVAPSFADFIQSLRPRS